MRFRTMSISAIGALVAGGLVLPAGAATAAQASFACTYQTWTLDYQRTITVVQDARAVRLTMSDFPAIVGPPAFVTASRVASSVQASAAGAPLAFAGSVDIDPPVPIADGFPMPQVSGQLPADFAGGALQITGLSFEMTAMGSTDLIECTMAAPISMAMAPVKQPVVAVPSKTKVSVKVKKKRVTVKAKVTAARPVSGQVKVVLKKGKKTIASKRAKVNGKGVATLKVKSKAIRKKLNGKAKGKIKAVVTYPGSAQVKASRGKATFKLR